MMATISTPISRKHEDANHVDDILVGAELAEMKKALLGDDAADQEGNEQNDRHGSPADPVQADERRKSSGMIRAPAIAANRARLSAPSMSTKATSLGATRR